MHSFNIRSCRWRGQQHLSDFIAVRQNTWFTDKLTADSPLTYPAGHHKRTQLTELGRVTSQPQERYLPFAPACVGAAASPAPVAPAAPSAAVWTVPLFVCCWPCAALAVSLPLTEPLSGLFRYLSAADRAPLLLLAYHWPSRCLDCPVICLPLTVRRSCC